MNGVQMTANLQEIIDQFQWADADMRLELLLDFSRKLPPLPKRYHAQRDAGVNRVHECQTPVFLFTELDEQGKMHFFVDVAEEAPTVQGLLSIILRGFENCTPKEIVDGIPADLLAKLGLNDQIRMTRAIGVAGMLGRIKEAARKQMNAAANVN